MWSVTSFTELRRDGIEVERWNMLHPTAKPRRAVRDRVLAGAPRPVSPRPTTSARSPTRSASGCPGRYRVLGTDGFGRSDSRAALRRFFEVDRHYVAVAALKALADEGELEPRARRRRRSRRYEIDPEAPMPTTV